MKSEKSNNVIDNESKPPEALRNEIISTFLPLFTGLAIVFGITYNIVFYNNFNIDITGYIDLTESLILFLQDLNGIILFLPLTLLAFTVLSQDDVTSDRIQAWPMFHFFYKPDGRANSTVMIWVAVCIGALYLTLEILKLYPFTYAVLMSFYLVFLPFYLLPIRDTVFKSKTVMLVVFLVVFLFINIFWVAESRTRQVLKNGRKLPNLIIKKKDGSFILTDNTIRYVGKTKSHLFLYDAHYKRQKRYLMRIFPKSRTRERIESKTF